MNRIAMQFCPSCGRYWVAASTEEASNKIEQRCSVCDVRVEYSWLGFTILALLLFILFATSVFELADRIAVVIFFLFLGIAAYKAIKQQRATQRRLGGRK